MNASAKPSSSRSDGRGARARLGSGPRLARDVVQARRARELARRTAPSSTRRDRSRARARDRAARASWRRGAAAPGPRCRGSRSRRPRRAAGSGGRAGARPAARPPRSRAAPAPGRTPPTPRLAWAAASARSARRAGSPVSATARWRKAAAAASPPRACARPADCSSSSATSSSGPAAAAARCQARRSGSALRVGHLRQRQMGRPALRPRRRIGTPPSAPADDGRSRASRASSRPSVASTAASSIPSRSDARRRSSGSPTGSAAATSNNRRASVGKRLEPADVALLDPSGERTAPPGSRTRPPAASRVSPRGSSSNASGIAARLRDDLVAHPLVEHRRQLRGQQRPRVAVAQAVHLELGEVPELLDPVRAPRTRSRPARPAGAGPRRRASAPTPGPPTARRRRRTAAGAPRPTSENRLSVASPTRNRSGGSPVRWPNTISSAWRCGAGSFGEPIEQRHAQLMQAGEGQLHLRLDACRAHDGHRRCGRDQVLQQRGLADSGLTAQHQRPALAALDRGDEPVELHALPGSPSQRLAQP